MVRSVNRLLLAAALLSSLGSCAPSAGRLNPVTVDGTLPIPAILVGGAFDYSGGLASGGNCTGEVIRLIGGDAGTCADLSTQQGLVEIWICAGRSPVSTGSYALGLGPLPDTNPSAVINYVPAAASGSVLSAFDGGLAISVSSDGALAGTFTASFDGGRVIAGDGGIYTASSTFSVPRCP